MGGPPDPPSPLFRAHIMNKCSGFRLFNIGRYACVHWLHMSFELKPVHSFASSSHYLTGLPRDLSPPTLPSKTVFAWVRFAPCPNYLSFLFLQQRVILLNDMVYIFVCILCHTEANKYTGCRPYVSNVFWAVH